MNCIKHLVILFFYLQTSLYSVDFVLFTQPKTGSHLLSEVLRELTGKKVFWPAEYIGNTNDLQIDNTIILEDPQYIVFAMRRPPWKKETLDLLLDTCATKKQFLQLHPPYSLVIEQYLTKRNCINFFIKRDPRDQIVSLLNHHIHIRFMNEKVKMLNSDDERLLFLIRDQIRSQIQTFKCWANSPLCCVLDFSKLMGSRGGVATNADAIGEMRKIADALQLAPSDKTLENIYHKCFGRGFTFFKGKVGSWKDYFNEEHTKATKEEIGDLLIELGYEQDLDW